MKSSKQIGKRSISPLISKITDTSSRKKKSSGHFQAVRDFETYGKTQKRKHLKELLQGGTNKYRIVTEPVQDRIMHLVSSSFARNARLEDPVNFKVRSSKCRHCQRYAEELEEAKTQLKEIIHSKIHWKSGKAEDYKHHKDSKREQSLEAIIKETKKHFEDLMKDIESLTTIDYPKMLKMNIFKYEFKPTQQNKQLKQLKSLFTQLRESIEGCVRPWDTEIVNEDSHNVQNILRNLKARLGNALRDNLQLKTKVAVLQKSEEITSQTEAYLHELLVKVLKSYT